MSKAAATIPKTVKKGWVQKSDFWLNRNRGDPDTSFREATHELHAPQKMKIERRFI